MDISFLSSPLFIALQTVVIVFLGVLFAIDKRRSSHDAQVRKHMYDFVATHALKSFTIVLNVPASVTTIVPLLEHVASMRHPGLEVILLTRPTLSRANSRLLRRIQTRLRGSVRIRIIQKHQTKNEKALVQRYASGEVICVLQPGQRLSKGFFTQMSFELLDDSVNSVIPRIVMAPDDSLASAYRALNLVAAQAIGFNAKNDGAKQPVVRVFRRQAYLQNLATNTVKTQRAMVTIQPLQSLRRHSWIEPSLLAAVATIGLLSYTLLPSGWYLMAVASAILFLGPIVLQLLTYPYRFWEKLNLILFVPLWPLVGTLAVSVKLLSRLWTTYKMHALRTAQLP